MNKHTPGPWLFRAKSNSVYTSPPPGTVYTYGSIIFSFHDVAEPSEADLALVLAAPDLLYELEETHAALCFTADYIGTLRYERNKAAIAKAQGEV